MQPDPAHGLKAIAVRAQLLPAYLGTAKLASIAQKQAAVAG